MRTLRIRSFTLLAFALVCTLPWIAYVAAYLATTGTLRLGAREQGPPPSGLWLAAFAGFAAAAVLIGYGMRRWIVRPLEGIGGASRQIAEGDLDVALPGSRIREISEARDGFETMAAGLRRSFRHQAELEEERRFFIGAIAHDLRTPLFA